MPYRQYTHCVLPADYQDPGFPSSFLDFLAQVLTDPLALPRWAATACPYLLGGKLVCLDVSSDQCAIGRITKKEAPADKSFPGSIDNDFSMNILLAPHSIEEMTAPNPATDPNPYLTNYIKIANDGLQGVLITEQPGMPVPISPKDPSDDPPGQMPSLRYQGEFTKYPDSNYPSYDPSHSPFQVAGSDGYPFFVPCLHVECEGSRINDVCNTINSFLGPVSSFCSVPIIGWITCFVATLVEAPLLVPAVIAAWNNAIDGNEADARVDGGGRLELGDLIVVTGRWVYDAGHQGWNELHPVKTIQLIGAEASDPAPDFNSWRDRWCGAIAVCPPYEGPGQRPADMNPGQTTTYESQTEPQNQWIFHPSVDGCADVPPPPR